MIVLKEQSTRTEKMNKRIQSCLKIQPCDIVCFICSLVIGITTNLYPNDTRIGKATVIRVIILTIMHFMLLRIVYCIFEDCQTQKDSNPLERNHLFAKCFFILLIIFLLPLIIYYPGVNGWDTEYQLVDLFDGTQVMHRDSWGDYYVTYTLSDHMNLFDTFLFGGFVKLGMIIGDASIGVFVYCVLQAALFAMVCSYSIEKLREWRINKTGCIIGFLFYALSPFIWMYSINMIKDSINASLFLLFFIKYIDIVRGEGEFGCGFFFLSLLVCLTKKTGILIAVPSNLILALILWKDGKSRVKSLTIALSPVLIISILLQKIIYPLFNIYQDGLQETLAFSFQQIARTAKYIPDAFSKADGNIINRVLDYNRLAELYDYHLVDYVKDTFRPTSSGMDFLNYILLWIKTGFYHPILYLRSLIGTNGGFFSPTYKINIYTKFNDWGNIGVSAKLWASGARTRFIETYEMLSDMPIVGVLFQTYFYSWILVCFTVWKAVKQKSKIIILSFIPVYISVVTLILSPEVNARYALHIIMIAPIMFAVSAAVVENG